MIKNFQILMPLFVAAGISACSPTASPNTKALCRDSGCAQTQSNARFAAESSKTELVLNENRDIALKPAQCADLGGKYLINKHFMISNRQGYEGAILQAHTLTLAKNQNLPDDSEIVVKCEYREGEASADTTRAFIVYESALAIFEESPISNASKSPVLYTLSEPLGISTEYFENAFKTIPAASGVTE
jgi:hypothetical protein